MASRLELHSILINVLGSDKVYFQPPPTFMLEYPCIIYSRTRLRTDFADNNPYLHRKSYQLTIIDQDPDSAIPDAIAALHACVFDRHFTSDGLNHDVFLISF